MKRQQLPFHPFLRKCHRGNPCNKMPYRLVRTSRFAMSMPHCNHQAHSLPRGLRLEGFDRCPRVSRTLRSRCRNLVFEGPIRRDHRVASLVTPGMTWAPTGRRALRQFCDLSGSRRSSAEVLLNSAFELHRHKPERTGAPLIGDPSVASNQIEPVRKRIVLAVGRVFHVINQSRDRQIQLERADRRDLGSGGKRRRLLE